MSDDMQMGRVEFGPELSDEEKRQRALERLRAMNAPAVLIGDTEAKYTNDTHGTGDGYETEIVITMDGVRERSERHTLHLAGEDIRFLLARVDALETFVATMREIIDYAENNHHGSTNWATVRIADALAAYEAALSEGAGE